MDSLIKSLSSGIELLIGIAIWAILFAVILEVLKKASPFEGWTRYVLAACVSLLSVIGMHRMLARRPAEGGDQGGIDPFSFLLVPYAAMGIAMLIVLLLLFLWRLACRSASRGEGLEAQPGGTSREQEDSEGDSDEGRCQGTDSIRSRDSVGWKKERWL